MKPEKSDERAEFSARFKAWEENELAAFLEKAPERQKEFRSLTGFPVERVYTPLDVADTPTEGPRLARASTPSRAARTRRCIAAASGRCARSRASAPPRTRTSASTT